jgi:LytTr DNA-binding domain
MSTTIFQNYLPNCTQIFISMNQNLSQKLLYYALSVTLLLSVFYLLSVFDTFGSFMHLFEKSHLHKWHTLFRFCFVLVFSIVNHLFFVPRLYIPKRYVLFFSIALLCLVMMIVLPDIILPKPFIDLKRFEPIHPNPLPPSPLLFEMVIMFLLFFMSVFTSIAIRTRQYVEQFEQNHRDATLNIVYQNETIINKQSETALTVTVNYGLMWIEFSDILFIKSMDNYLQFHLKDKKPILVRMTLKDAIEKLPINQFLRVHKSYIISIAAIESIRNKTILIANQEIPIGRLYEESVSKIF